MISMVRVDDRLLHGQVLCAWVPHVRADTMIVASDDAAGDEIAREVICSCAHDDMKVEVVRIDEVAGLLAEDRLADARAMVIVGSLQDAMRLHDGGVRFTELNIGNLHHESGGTMIAPSIIIDEEDTALLDQFASLGVELDLRAMPASRPGEYRPATGDGL
jgi:PTS system mannose-specific IIB component